MSQQIPVTNLKDRIAALEQRNAANAKRSASPSPAIGSGGSPLIGGSVGGGGGGGGGLREKIARFEKKGGVPVPRGTFGLGAPPPPEARVHRTGELYGNRIPQPLRMNHTGGGTPSRSGSSMGFYAMDLNSDDPRRSVSMSSVITDLDDRPDYTPLASPTFEFPETSPNSTVAAWTPEGSPTLPDPKPATGLGIGAAPLANRPIASRSTSFAQAVELAKKVAEAGGTVDKPLQDGAAPTPFIVNTAAIKKGFEQPATTETQAAVVEEPAPITSEPTSMTREETSASPSDAQKPPSPIIIVEPTADEVPTPVVESPQQSLPSPEVVASPPKTPEVEAPPTPEPVPQPSFTPPVLEAPVPLEIRKPVTRNNKDLTLNVEALKISTPPTAAPAAKEASRPSVDETTPTTSSYGSLPLPTGIPSAALSPNSLGSSPASSLTSPRPYSMVELAWAERVTPATSRGNVMFIPPSATPLPRKSDLVDYPPTPATTEQQVQRNGSAKPVQFSAVVHQKVREAEVQLPSTPERPKTPKKQKRMTMMPLQSPGGPELIALMQHAVMLESSLETGELPTEVIQRKKEEENVRTAQDITAALAAEKAKSDQEELKKLAFQTQSTSKDGEDQLSRSARLRHTFLIPLSKARSQHRKERSASVMETHSRDLSRSDLPDLPERLPSPGAESLESPPPPVPALPPMPSPSAPLKSAGVTKSSSRFSSFRRLGSVKSVIGMPSGGGGGSSSRRSVSSDDAHDGSVGHSEFDEFGMTTAENGSSKQSWPNLSPSKKGSMSRASTIAGKMFSRSRTKSSGSTLSNMSDSGSSRAASVYTLPPLPDALSVIPPSPEFEVQERPIRRSISMKSLKSALKGRTSTDSARAPPVPRISTNHETPKQPPPPQPISIESTSPTSTIGSPGNLKSPDYLGYGSFNPPDDGSTRPMSWMSGSSTLPSPLFDKDIFDAFPAVPQTANGLDTPSHGGLQSAALVTPSFDSAFLNSAIHLAGSTKSTIGTPTTATGAYSPLPPMSAATIGHGHAPLQRMQMQSQVPAGVRRSDNKF